MRIGRAFARGGRFDRLNLTDIAVFHGVQRSLPGTRLAEAVGLKTMGSIPPLGSLQVATALNSATGGKACGNEGSRNASGSAGLF
jgi:hypothetical protein